MSEAKGQSDVPSRPLLEELVIGHTNAVIKDLKAKKGEVRSGEGAKPREESKVEKIVDDTEGKNNSTDLDLGIVQTLFKLVASNIAKFVVLLGIHLCS